MDTRVSITGYNGVTTTLDPYTGSATVNITGHYGTLAIAADGHYTYTLNSGVSLSSMTSKETFNYTLTDATGKTDSASLTINMAPQFISSEHNDVITGTAYGDTLIYQVLNNTVGNATGGTSAAPRATTGPASRWRRGIKSTLATCWWAGTVAPPRSGTTSMSLIVMVIP